MQSSRYRNPIPILLTAEEESQFYQPITDLLNRLVKDEILIPNSDYFILRVRYEAFPECIQAFKSLGIVFNNVIMTFKKDIVKLDASKAFNAYRGNVRKSFIMQHVDGVTPAYLDKKGSLSYCCEGCDNKTCERKEVPYCARLYVAVKCIPDLRTNEGKETR